MLLLGENFLILVIGAWLERLIIQPSSGAKKKNTRQAVLIKQQESRQNKIQKSKEFREKGFSNDKYFYFEILIIKNVEVLKFIILFYLLSFWDFYKSKAFESDPF